MATNTEEERKELWSDLKSHQDSPLFRNTPWIVFGDFNETLDAEEHSDYAISPTVSQGMREFQEVTMHCSLMDLSFHGPRLTWCNRREEGIICKKLDRTLINQSWISKVPDSYCVFEPGGCSDHLRCRIRIKADLQKPKKPFKFTNAVAEHPGFLPLVESYWNETEGIHRSTSALYRLSKKLKGLKPLIRGLSKEAVGDIKKKTQDALKHLCDAQKQTMLNPSQRNVREETDAYERWSLLSGIEEKVISQKAKIHWLKVGDSNNKQFYQVATVRKSKNSIRELQRDDGTIAETQDDLKKEAVDYFHGFLAQKVAGFETIAEEELHNILGFECDAADQASLISNVTDEEVRKTLFSMARNKSPGPDGFTCEFYKATWSIVGKEVVTAIQSFFDNGFLPTGVNSTILALIPKKEEAKHIKDYRPISCCNVLYKVISKIIANRLKVMLPKFVSPNQSAFVKNRLLMENVLLASELVKNYHKDNISPRCALKIDISKAFDSVQWSFLLATLSALKFPDKFILWIKRCVTLASFSVQVNGELAGYFKSERGLRQGCSLSPYLFVICMHVLSKILDKAADDQKTGYHPYCQALQLTHLCFADDLLVFSDGTKRSIDGILEVFKRFATISGLHISVEKSTIYMAGVRDAEKERILDQFAFDSGMLPVRYLGLPLMTKRMSVTDYTPLIEKIRRRISSWTARSLSLAGRLQLIGSVILSLTNFWISAFRLPKACIKEIDKLCAAFLGSGPDLNPKKAKIAWTEVTRPKEEGGLGLKSINEANNVSCLKLIWRILSEPSSLWVRWIHKYLIRKGSFWSANDKSSLGSWIWKKLLKFRTLAATLTKVEVQNGADTSFWFDVWSPMGRLYDLTGARGCIDLGISIDATVEQAVTDRRRRNHRVHALNQIEREIQILWEHGLNGEKDVHLWKHTDNSFKTVFSSKATWKLIRDVTPRVSWSRGIWFSYSTPKYAVITWLAAHNKLSTGDRILKWSPNSDPRCVLCQSHTETRDHLFFICAYTKEIWETLGRRLLGNKYTFCWNDILQTLVDGIQDKTKLYLSRYLFQATVHTLWLERCARKHGEEPRPAAVLIKQIDKIVRNRLSSITAIGVTKHTNGLQLWFAAQVH